MKVAGAVDDSAGFGARMAACMVKYEHTFDRKRRKNVRKRRVFSMKDRQLLAKMPKLAAQTGTIKNARLYAKELISAEGEKVLGVFRLTFGAERSCHG